MSTRTSWSGALRSARNAMVIAGAIAGAVTMGAVQTGCARSRDVERMQAESRQQISALEQRVAAIEGYLRAATAGGAAPAQPAGFVPAR